MGIAGFFGFMFSLTWLMNTLGIWNVDLENPLLDNMIWFLVFATMCLILFTIKFIFY